MSSATKAVAASFAMLSLVTAQTIASKRGRTDFGMKNTWARLKLIDVEREIRDELYFIVFSVHIEELELSYS